MKAENLIWKLESSSYQIADTGDYDGHYEITNGKISLLTKDDDDEALQTIVDAFNDAGCDFYQDDCFEFENRQLKEDLENFKWKKTMEELPPKDGKNPGFSIDCLVTDGGIIKYDYYNFETDKFQSNNKFYSYWMTAPIPPDGR